MSEPAYLASLNTPQKQAVTTTKGPVLILAGAGAGKTRVITHRIIHLLHEGVCPGQILAMTFTNKAAKEMLERVQELTLRYPILDRSLEGQWPVITTFHAFGVRVLREYHALLGLPKYFTIFDRSDSVRVMKQAVTEAQYNPKEFEPRRILSKVSRAKGDALSQSSFAATATTFPDQVTAACWAQYDRLVAAEGGLDFDDLLLKTLRLLQDNETVRTRLQERYAYIHIDEYQDTNKVQLEIAKLLTGPQRNICVVGDIDQNIYSWRGADIQNVLQFETLFPGAQTILLEENYRSTKTIIAAANDVIAKNKNRVEKTAFTNNADGDQITLYAAMNGVDEAEYIARTAGTLITAGTDPSDIAVLYRTNFQSRTLEEAFINYGISYQLLGTKFFERKEVKDVVAYLRLAMAPENYGDLARVINEPPRGIGKVTVLKILQGERDTLRGAIAEKVDRFYTMMIDIADTARTESLSETIKFIIARTGLETYYKKEGTEDDLSRLENLRELVTLATRFDTLDTDEAIAQFLETAALQSDQDELKDKAEHNAVRLMTVHAAKGLEFKTVFITGLEEGLFPHERLDDGAIDREEERRLFYVALTRAEAKLYLTYAHTRMVYGSTRVNIPSSFLNDIGTEYVESGNPPGFGSQKSGYETTIWLD